MASRRKRLLEPDLPGGFDEDGARREASRLKVPALRAALAALDADASGNKAELVDRLVASQKAAAPPPPPVEPRRLPWVTHAPHDRIARALTQRLYLIEQEEEDSGRKYAVLGSTGNVYTVKVGALVSCDCPDAAKGNVCKHQLFVMLKVLRASESSKLIYQRALLSHELAELFSKGGAARPEAVASSSVVEAYAEATGKSKAPAEEEAAAAPLRNSDCPVCFEALGTEKCEVCAMGRVSDCRRLTPHRLSLAPPSTGVRHLPQRHPRRVLRDVGAHQGHRRRHVPALPLGVARGGDE